MNNNDEYIELIEQTNKLSDVNQTVKIILQNPQSIKKNEQLNINEMEKSILHEDSTPNQSSETSEVIILTTSVSLKV